jgi:hypothetical protein
MIGLFKLGENSSAPIVVASSVSLRLTLKGGSIEQSDAKPPLKRMNVVRDHLWFVIT